MRRGLAVLSILVGLVLISLPVQAQDIVEEEGNVIIDIVLPIALAFIMFSLGLGLTKADFFLVFNEPKAFAIGVFNQMIVLPIIGFSVVTDSYTHLTLPTNYSIYISEVAVS